MIKYFRQPLDFLLFSNIFISLGAAAQGLVTYHLLGFDINWFVIGCLFFSTIVSYNFSILIQKPKNPQLSEYRRVRWIFNHYKMNVGITVFAALALIPCFLELHLKAQILLVILGIISIGYSTPLFSIGKTKHGLRNIPGLKLFLIALVWALSSVWFPYVEFIATHQTNTNVLDLILLIIKRLLFVTAITIPCDIRDMLQDSKYKLKTIATVYGEKKAYLFCQILLITYFFLSVLFPSAGLNLDFYGLSSTIFLTAWLIFKSKWEKNEYYYFFYLDGTLVLQYVLLLLFNLI
jgi:4-hydroxybenzoate polyprenyltransferase